MTGNPGENPGGLVVGLMNQQHQYANSGVSMGAFSRRNTGEAGNTADIPAVCQL